MRTAFKFHKLNETGIKKCEAIGQKFDDLLSFVEAQTPPNRELSLTITKLEEACFYAKKAVAQNKEHQA